MELNSCSIAGDGLLSHFGPTDKHRPDPGTECPSPSAAWGQSLPFLASPPTTLGTGTTHLDQVVVGALDGESCEVPRPYRLNTTPLHHPSAWDEQEIDTIQANKAHSDPGHTSQTAGDPYIIAKSTVQGLKKEIEELEELLRISNNTVASLDKLVVRYRSIYGELSEDGEPQQSDDDSPLRGRKRSRSMSRSRSPGNLTSHSAMSQPYADYREHGDSAIAYSRKSYSRSSSLSSRVGNQTHSIDGRSPRTSQDEPSYMETPGRLADPGDETSRHELRRGSIQIVSNSRTPSPLPESIDYDSEEDFACQLHSNRSARSVSVAHDGQPIGHQRSFENPEADCDAQRIDGKRSDRVVVPARRPARRPSPVRSSWRHWTNPALHADDSMNTPAFNGRSGGFVPEGSRTRSRYRGPGPAHPFRRKIMMSHSASRAKANLPPRYRPQPSPSRASNHRNAMDFGTPSSRDFAERRRRTQEPRLLHRLSHFPQQEPRRPHPEYSSPNMRNYSERPSPYHNAHPRGRHDGDRRRESLRERTGGRY